MPILDTHPLDPGYVYFDKYRAEDDSFPQSIENDVPFFSKGATARDSVLGPWTRVGTDTVLSETVFGAYSYIVRGSSAVYSRIGKYCSIAQGARINPGNHPTWRAAQHHFSYRAVSYHMGEEDDHDFFQWRRDDQVNIGHDVWIGHGVTVLAGVNIGTGCVIGAGAVVSKDVPDYTIVAGVPSKPIRERFPLEIQKGLLELKWWDWEHQKMADALHDFRNLSAEQFINKYI